MAGKLDYGYYELSYLHVEGEELRKIMRKRKMKTIKQIALVFSFLLMMFPLQVSAAGGRITKKLTFTVPSMREAEKQAEEAFGETLKEQGKEYELEDLEYVLIRTDYLGKKEKRVELKEKPEETLMEGGVEYTLKSSEKQERVITEASEQTVTVYEDYDHEVTEADVPASRTVTAVNESTGREEEVVCYLAGISEAGTAAVENVMTVTFTDYESAYYEWNGELLPHNDDMPPLAGHEDSLLESAGAAPGSEVAGFYWSGEPYTVDGVVYRDAAATVLQQVQMYRADYTGKIITPETKETVYKAVYETPDQEGDKQYTVKAAATYTEAEKSYAPYMIAAGVGVAVLAGLVAVILIILAKKKKQEEEQK